MGYQIFLPKPEASKKKNYIGDQIIVEKDQDEEETARGHPQDIDAPASTAPTSKYA